MISVFLVITLLTAGAPPKERHRLAMPSAEECVKRGQALAETLLPEFRKGVTISVACEFSKT